MALAVALGAAAPAGAAAEGLPGAPRAGTGSGVTDDAAIERARQAVLDDSYQPELPRYRAGRGSGGGASALPGRRAGGELDEAERARTVDTRSHEDARGSSVMTFVMWALVVVAAVLLASWLASELSRYGGDAELAVDPDARERMQAASAAIIERPLGDADELAGRREFAEAIHTLLLRTLHELARSAALRVAPAMTSREILARVPLVADARSALAGLITAVEITHFGDEPANAADYERCRQQFTMFAVAFRTGGAARTGAAA
ncbi:MAG TPA: DUF4129 domain-containing protein [Kofleriaceae bacterium]|nr:DUF4129 domain-containing protein [Kofleriaceae bacterium]